MSHLKLREDRVRYISIKPGKNRRPTGAGQTKACPARKVGRICRDRKTRTGRASSRYQNNELKACAMGRKGVDNSGKGGIPLDYQHFTVIISFSSHRSDTCVYILQLRRVEVKMKSSSKSSEDSNIANLIFMKP